MPLTPDDKAEIAHMVGEMLRTMGISQQSAPTDQFQLKCPSCAEAIINRPDQKPYLRWVSDDSRRARIWFCGNCLKVLSVETLVGAP